jgi:carboxyl-terminal processing protease
MWYDSISIDRRVSYRSAIVNRVLRTRLLLLIVPIWLLTVAAGVGGGYWFALERTSPCPEAPEVCEAFGTFWEAWNIASDNFVDAEAIEPQAMTEGAIEGMLDSLGDEGHTRFLSAEAAEQWRESLSGSFEGVGATLDIREENPIIVSTIEGSPAEAAGIRAGDLLLEVDGVSVTGLTIEEVVAQVRGPAGSEVTLTVQHEGEQLPVDITVTRAKIAVPNVTWSMLPNDVALVHLVQFAQGSSDQLREALNEARQAGARAIVFDMRDNPGGLVREAMAVASEFLPPDTTVFVQADRAGNRAPYTTEGDGVARDIPLVVLVNQNSASSAEIVSGALQENGRAEVIGVPTAGTGTVLSTFTLDDGAQVLLGTQQWLTPQGNLIKGQGITPDQVVQLEVGEQRLTPREAGELPLDSLRASADVQLVAALDALAAQASQ